MISLMVMIGYLLQMRVILLFGLFRTFFIHNCHNFDELFIVKISLKFNKYCFIFNHHD